MSWAREVIDFWFGLDPEQWWKSDPAVDEEVRKRFLDLWEEQRQHRPTDFLGSADDALAAILLFDQFPRNMFRNHADSFATDHLALAIARLAIDRGDDIQLEQPRRGFFYMPFQHSEDEEDQRRSMALFTALGDAEQLHFARTHHDMIERFGRFPHRNAMLGRKSRPDEVAAGNPFPS